MLSDNQSNDNETLLLEGSDDSFQSDDAPHVGEVDELNLQVESTGTGSVAGMEKQSLLRKCRTYVTEPGTLICISHLFSYWGDRMWGFAVGLYLVEMTPNSLRLTAIYGLVRTLSVVLFGPAVGDWVDVTPRLRAVKLSLVTQNILVSLCAVMVLLHLLIHASREEKAVYIVLEAAIIILGAMAFLVGRGTTIAVERDWVVVICDGDKDKLAGLNTKLRRIDLTCAILGPAAVGFIMSLVSKYAGIILICSWNIASFFLEYYLLLHVYKLVPGLASKEIKVVNASSSNTVNDPQGETSEGTINGDVDVKVKGGLGYTSLNLWQRIRSFLKGWSVYAKQNVALAGLSLAMLYLTFLGFSSITTGYVYTQHLTEGVISACYAAASLVGILGTVLFPPIRRKVGLPKTGIISFLLQLAMLALCVLSIWLPGSPLFSKAKSSSGKIIATNSAMIAPKTLTPTLSAVRPKSSKGIDTYSRTIYVRQSVHPTTSISMMTNDSVNRKSHMTTAKSGIIVSTLSAPTLAVDSISRNLTADIKPTTHFHTIHTSLYHTVSNFSKNATQPATHFSYWSVSILVTGLILSRAGLWMTDLTVTQLMQENVIETERGIVSGTQQAFNSILDLMHYVLTIFLPRPEQFWMLILVSYAAVSSGYIIYIVFYFRFSRKPAQDRSQTVVYGSSEHLIGEET